MAPPNRILQPDSFAAILNEIDRRLKLLETAPSLANSSVNSGYVASNDGTRDRAQFGKLAAYTDPRGVVSPADFGLRTLDATGNVITDPTALASVMKQVAFTSLAPQAQTLTGTGLGTFTDLAMSNAGTFTVPTGRVVSFLILSNMLAVTAGAGGTFARLLTTYSGGGVIQTVNDWDKGNAGYVPATRFTVLSLSAGTYGVKFRASTDVGQTATFASGDILVLQMGG